MVNFLSELVSGEDDEPPPSVEEEELNTFSLYDLSGIEYHSSVGDYVSCKFVAGARGNQDNIIAEGSTTEDIPEDYHSWMPDESYVTFPESGVGDEQESFEQIRKTLEEPGWSFEQAMVEYIFEPPSLEGDILADDRELMDDPQRALIPYFWKQMQRRAEDEDRIFQRQLGYKA